MENKTDKNTKVNQCGDGMEIAKLDVERLELWRNLGFFAI